MQLDDHQAFKTTVCWWSSYFTWYPYYHGYMNCCQSGVFTSKWVMSMIWAKHCCNPALVWRLVLPDPMKSADRVRGWILQTTKQRRGCLKRQPNSEAARRFCVQEHYAAYSPMRRKSIQNRTRLPVPRGNDFTVLIRDKALFQQWLHLFHWSGHSDVSTQSQQTHPCYLCCKQRGMTVHSKSGQAYKTRWQQAHSEHGLFHPQLKDTIWEELTSSLLNANEDIYTSPDGILGRCFISESVQLYTLFVLHFGSNGKGNLPQRSSATRTLRLMSPWTRMILLDSRCNHSNRQSFIRSADVRGICSVSRFYKTEPKADDTEYILSFYLSAVQVGTRRVQCSIWEDSQWLVYMRTSSTAWLQYAPIYKYWFYLESSTQEDKEIKQTIMATCDQRTNILKMSKCTYTSLHV